MEQHVKVRIEANGKERVSFHTQYGWVEDTSITIDCISLEDARKQVTDFLKTLDCVPFENCSSNEEYTEEGNDVIGELIDTVANLKAMPEDGKVEYNIVYPLNLTVKLQNSYIVHFGEES